MPGALSASAADPRRVVHLACSRGGHLDLLLRLEGVLADRRLVWVTQESGRVADIRRAGGRVHVLGEYHGSLRGIAGVVWRSIGVLLRERPRFVITSGSGIVVPFCLLARLTGAKVVFIETSARVRGASRSGRVLSRIANRVIVQWDEMRAVYPGAAVAQSSVLLGIAPQVSGDGAGTFLAVGTHSQPFDRIVELVDRAAGEGVLPQPVLAQVGVSTVAMRHGEAHGIITPEEMGDAVRRSRYIVTHAGTGTISTALRAGRRPLVLARTAAHGEHFDDHQQQIVDKLAELGLVVPLGDRITAADLEAADAPLPRPEDLPQHPSLADRMREALADLDG
jgi:UDP-N-acetylglucosamine--N-acetylmuramyl-(pentapeptide) pyrophosphoryl-undecaprenol N-acetylglucosamine transferase